MNPAVLLGLAQVGVSILGARGQQRAITQQRLEAVRAGTLERLQMREQGRVEAADRQRYLASVLGSQRAALAAGGVSGGRTAQLLAAQAQFGAARAQETADYNLRMGLRASEDRQRATMAGLSAAARQTSIDLLGGIVGAGVGVHQGLQAQKAAQGGK